MRTDLVDKLSRPYPIQTPGALSKLEYDFTAHRLIVEADVTDTKVPMVLFAPRRHLSEALCLTVTGPASYQWDEARGERLLVQFAAPGHFLVRLARCE